jgi:hypothetical protein
VFSFCKIYSIPDTRHETMSAFAFRGAKLSSSSQYELVSPTDGRPSFNSATSTASSDDEEDLFRATVEDPLERDARDAVRESALFRKLAVVIPAMATIGVNIFAMISGGGSIVVIVAGAIAVLLSSSILVMEVAMEDLESKF